MVDGDRYHRSVNETVTGNCTISKYLARNDNLEKLQSELKSEIGDII